MQFLITIFAFAPFLLTAVMGAGMNLKVCTDVAGVYRIELPVTDCCDEIESTSGRVLFACEALQQGSPHGDNTTCTGCSQVPTQSSHDQIQRSLKADNGRGVDLHAAFFASACRFVVSPASLRFSLSEMASPLQVHAPLSTVILRC